MVLALLITSSCSRYLSSVLTWEDEGWREEESGLQSDKYNTGGVTVTYTMVCGPA